LRFYTSFCMVTLKPIEFLGSARRSLAGFPDEPRRMAGLQLDRVQRGVEPFDWKPMSSVGAGVLEIRIRSQDGVYRIIYVAKFPEAVYVLHAFQKKARKTSRLDLELARARYAEIFRSRP
jgi:phage-related protein